MKKILILLLVLLTLAGCEMYDPPLEISDSVQVRVQEWSIEYLGEDNAFFELEDDLDGYLQIAHVIGPHDIKVKTYDADKEEIETITTRPGIVGLDFDSDPKYMQVITEGEWDIAQVPLGAAPDVIEEDSSFSFTGNNVMIISPETTEDMEVYMKSQGKVEVNVWGPEREVLDTNHAYEGTFDISPHPTDMAIEIITDGDVYVKTRRK